MCALQRIIDELSKLQNCIIDMPCGLPHVPEELQLPEDLIEFYTICGGCRLFIGQKAELKIVGPDHFQLSNESIFTQTTTSGLTKKIREYLNPLSWTWYLLAIGQNWQFISIDLDPYYLGRCYDSFYDIYPNDSPVIANTLSEFLEKYVQTSGSNFYWLE